ncbi:ATP-binding protein [Streptomyces griseoluteus]|jgi:anti-sigma regulatory factor (Ser/Thr protein kinase)|uniref:ATP-binding protein n=1 Tax=Streptomyces griseoluteus TaxID=29306 RepID=UPI0034495E98
MIPSSLTVHPAPVPQSGEEDEQILPLPGCPRLLAGIRRHARVTLADWALPQEVADDTLLVVSELISNAVLHALPPAFLRLVRRRTETGGTLGIEVTDGGPVARQPTDHSTAPDEHGRGLTIVRALSTDHGTRGGPDGSATWWAELSTP